MRIGLHNNLFVSDIDDPRDREALAQHLVDQHDQGRAENRAQHTPAPARNRGPAHDHRGDHNQFRTLPVLRRYALVLRDNHQPRNTRRQRRDQIGPHPDPACRNPRIARGLLIAANRIGFVSRPRFRQREHADHGNGKENQNLRIEPERVRLAENEKGAIPHCLGIKRNRLAAGEPQH